jgi:hypothetical protein
MLSGRQERSLATPAGCGVGGEIARVRYLML